MLKYSQDVYDVLVPLRGGSKSIPKKNIKLIAGKPLAFWAVDEALKCEKINQIFISTDSNEIADIFSGYDERLHIIERPSQYATDEASTESVMLHALPCITTESLITMQATSPLVTSRDLMEAMFLFESGQYDSLLTAVRLKRFLWTDECKPVNYNPLKRPRRQEFLGTLMENGAFYITRKQILSEQRCRLGGVIGIYEMDEYSSLELDEPNDWVLIESLLKERGGA